MHTKNNTHLYIVRAKEKDESSEFIACLLVILIVGMLIGRFL